jgi:hypothetical protein
VAKLPFPDVSPGPLHELLEELHKLHARAGWPSVRELARGQNFSHTAVHELFTKSIGDRKLPVLLSVVEKLAKLAPRVDQEATLDKFDQLWDTATGRTRTEQQDDAATQWSFVERFYADLKSVVQQEGKSVGFRKLSERTQLSGLMIQNILNGTIAPRQEYLRPILEAASASDADIDRLLTQSTEVRHWIAMQRDLGRGAEGTRSSRFL